jgi:hypothetical protein
MLIHAPDHWPTAVVATVAMALLAGLDLAGSFAAKEAVLRKSVWIGAAGALIFVVLFWVLASTLQYAELAPVTFGWIVILQIGVLVLDRYRYGTQISPGAWVAVAAMLVAQGYLVLGAPSHPEGDESSASAEVVVAGSAR